MQNMENCMKAIKYLLIVSLIVLSGSCTSKPRVVKSPCVDNGSGAVPCFKREANKWLA